MQAKASPSPSLDFGAVPQCRIRISSDLMAVRDALVALFGTGFLCDLPIAERGTAEIVLAEAMNNIVEHAYADASGQIDIALWLSPTDLLCQIEDEGRPMPGGVLPVGSLPAFSDQDGLPEGGFGWHLIRTLCRDLTYDRRDGRNRLRFYLDAK